jgi:short-subunit dehydrogenase
VYMALKSYKDAVIVITGASGGIGAEVAQLVAARGAIPILLARRADKLAEVGARIKGEKGLFTADVTDKDRIAEVVEEVIEKYGKIDIWINNAGFGQFENVLDMSMDQFEQLMRVNYYAVVHCTKAVLPHMLRAEKGQIINVASVAGKIGTPKGAGYSASKHAVLGFTNSLRGELAGSGVKVSTLNPGPVDTPFFEISDPHGHYKSRIERYMLQPLTVAKAMLRLIETGKADITIPLTASWGAKLLQLFPNGLASIAGKLLNKK